MKLSGIQCMSSKTEKQTNWSYFYVNVITFFMKKYFKYILMR